MDEDEIKAEARLFALESVVCQLAAMMLIQTGGDDALAMLQQQVHQQIAGARQKTFSELSDPALSDLMAAELEAAIGRLGQMQKELVALVLRHVGKS